MGAFNLKRAEIEGIRSHYNDIHAACVSSGGQGDPTLAAQLRNDKVNTSFTDLGGLFSLLILVFHLISSPNMHFYCHFQTDR